MKLPLESWFARNPAKNHDILQGVLGLVFFAAFLNFIASGLHPLAFLGGACLSGGGGLYLTELKYRAWPGWFEASCEGARLFDKYGV